jgi:hypothetical protein
VNSLVAIEVVVVEAAWAAVVLPVGARKAEKRKMKVNKYSSANKDLPSTLEAV